MKIIFICTSNICRSVMAEAILKGKLKNGDLNGSIEVYSAGIFAESGEKPMQNVIETMQEYGLDVKHHKAISLNEAKIQQMDLILCASETNKKTMIKLYPNLKEHMYTLKEYLQENENKDIIEPWGYDIEIYRMCAAEIEKCIDKLIEKIM